MNHAGNWVRTTMTQMNTRITKTYASDARGQVHRTTRLNVVTVFDGTVEVFFTHAQCMKRPNIRNRV